MLIEQNATYEKDRGTTSIEKSRRTIARDQYQYN